MGAVTFASTPRVCGGGESAFEGRLVFVGASESPPELVPRTAMKIQCVAKPKVENCQVDGWMERWYVRTKGDTMMVTKWVGGGGLVCGPCVREPWCA